MTKTLTPGRFAREQARREKDAARLHKDSDGLLTAQEVADLLRVSLHYVRKLSACRNGVPPSIPHIKIGRSIRFDKRQILAWVQDRKTKPARAKDIGGSADRPELYNAEPACINNNGVMFMQRNSDNEKQIRYSRRNIESLSIAELLASCDNHY
jgi:excisionase family DNA binding protein